MMELVKSTVRPWPSVHAAVVQYLQQHVEDIRMGLFHFVEQHHLIGPAPHRLGQGAAFIVADISGRRADQAGNGMLLHIFRHIDAGHGTFIVKQEFRQGLAQFRLAHAGRAQETGTSRWAARDPAARPGPGAPRWPRRPTPRPDRSPARPDAVSMARSLSRSPASIFSTGMPVQTRHHGGDIFFAHHFAQHGPGAANTPRADGFRLRDTLVQVRDDAIGTIRTPGPDRPGVGLSPPPGGHVRAVPSALGPRSTFPFRPARPPSDGPIGSPDPPIRFPTCPRRSREASSFSFFRASRSIFNWMMRRSSSSISSGLESTSMRMRLAASSIRSMALSGKKRSVM